MKDILRHINKAFENKIRLGIMSSLMVNAEMNFKALKELLDVTDGNLASHLKTLESKKYIVVTKEFIDRKPNTRYAVSADGKQAFTDHIHAIERLLKG